MRTKAQTALVVAVTVMLVLSSGAVAAMHGMGGETEALGPADEVFVLENGDAVLVYYKDTPSETVSGHYGLDVSEGLMHIVMTDQSTSNTTGEASVVVTPDSLVGDGSFVIPTVDTLKDLTADASIVQTDEESKRSVSLDARFEDEAAAETADTTLAVKSEGTMTAGSAFTSTGTLIVATVGSQDDATLPTTDSYEVRLVETADGYELQSVKNYVVDEFAVDDWNTIEAATQTLEQRYAMMADALDGDSAVTVASHSFDAETDRLDIEYTVQFTGVTESISMSLAELLATSMGAELSDSQLEQVAQRLQKVEVTNVGFALNVTDAGMAKTTTLDWDIQIDNAREITRAAVDVLALSEALDDDPLEDTLKYVDSMEAANLESTVSWQVGYSALKTGTTMVDVTATAEANNWKQFVYEMESRDADPGQANATFNAKTEDGTIVASFSVEVQQDELVEMALERMLATSDSTNAEKASEHLDAFEESEFELARVDVSMDAGTVTFEGAASFEDLSPLAALMSEKLGDLSVDSVYSEKEAGQKTVYVRVTGATVANPSITDVEALSVVGPETTIYMPGEWSPEETVFPEMDTMYVEGFLAGAEPSEEAGDEAAGDAESGEATDDESELPAEIPFFAGSALLAGVAAREYRTRRDGE
jgi:hypothetical protein